MGGKSSSSTSQASSQETVQLDTDTGVLSGTQVLGRDISIVQQIPEELAKVFGQMIDLVGDTVSVAENAGAAALTAVSQKSERVENPELANLTKIMPAIIIGIIAVSVIMVFRKK
jgi:hypothetical protein